MKTEKEIIEDYYKAIIEKLQQKILELEWEVYKLTHESETIKMDYLKTI